MKARWLGMLLVAGTAAGIAQTQPTKGDEPAHFRWSERLAHELRYQNTIRTSTDLTPEQRGAILNAVLGQLKRQKLEDVSPAGLRRLAFNTRIEFVDLNHDGTNEVIAQSNGVEACGATGNCFLWIFQPTDDGYKLLLDGGGQVLRILDSSTSGYQDVVLGSHDSASERTLLVYTYRNGRYRRSECYSLSWMADNFHTLESPRIWPCKIGK
jgi:hypothetical protein